MAKLTIKIERKVNKGYFATLAESVAEGIIGEGYGKGRTINEAIGDLVTQYPDKFNVEIK